MLNTPKPSPNFPRSKCIHFFFFISNILFNEENTYSRINMQGKRNHRKNSEDQFHDFSRALRVFLGRERGDDQIYQIPRLIVPMDFQSHYSFRQLHSFHFSCQETQLGLYSQMDYIVNGDRWGFALIPPPPSIMLLLQFIYLYCQE